MATKLNFLQYTYRFRVNHKTLYSQTFPGPNFGSWTSIGSWDTIVIEVKMIGGGGGGGGGGIENGKQNCVWLN